MGVIYLQASSRTSWSVPGSSVSPTCRRHTLSVAICVAVPAGLLCLLGSCACKRESSSCIPQPGMGTTSWPLAGRRNSGPGAAKGRHCLFITSSSTAPVSARRNLLHVCFHLCFPISGFNPHILKRKRKKE